MTVTVVRSKGFPLFSLPEALERVRKIFDAEPHNEMTPEAAAKHMGYSGISGASLRTIATLRRYGLLEGRGDRVKVSRDAVTILADEKAEDQADRSGALQRSAKSDSVFADLAQSFKGIPALATLVPYLVKKGFKQEDAAQIANNYRATLEFVQQQAKVHNEQDPEDESSVREKVTNPPPAGTRAVQLPLSPSSWATLSAPFPVSEAAWTQMIAILNAMKPALVQMGSGTDEPKDPK